jgi:hypothetical protein
MTTIDARLAHAPNVFELDDVGDDAPLEGRWRSSSTRGFSPRRPLRKLTEAFARRSHHRAIGSAGLSGHRRCARVAETPSALRWREKLDCGDPS